MTEIEEFENWITDKKNTSNEDLKSYFYFINQRIIFLKTIRYINEGKLKKAIKNIFFFPINFNKIKLILYIILPKKFLSKVRRYHW